MLIQLSPKSRETTPMRLWPWLWLMLSMAFVCLPAVIQAAENVDIARMSDVQVREKLIELTAQSNPPPGAGNYGAATAETAGMLAEVKHTSSQFENSLIRIKGSLGRWDQQLERMWQNLSGQQEWAGVARLLGWLGLMLLCGLALEKVLGWRLQRLGDNIAHQTTHEWLTILCYLLLRMLMSLVRVGVFFLGAGIVPLLVTGSGSAARGVLFAVLAVVVTVRLVAVLAQAILAPTARGIRPLSLHCDQAALLYKWVLAFTLSYAALVYGVELLVTLGLEAVMAQAIVPAGGLLLTAMINALIWTQRDTIGQLFSDNQSRDSNLQQVILQSWPILASMWLLTLWVLWGYAVFVGDVEAAAKLTISWWITLLFPLVDRLFHALLARLVTLGWLQSPRFEQRSRRFRSILQSGLRLILLALAVFFLAEGWGFETMEMIEASWIQHLLEALVDILVIILVAFITWELIQSAIERRLPEPVEQDNESPEGEGGGGGVSRTETLLPLLRSFILAVLVVTVVLSILSSIGVEIGPLLAGAGVVGIAVGFGAQKLVADVISGVFFLLDDAFRRGEYIEAAGMRGTVENISVRSMRLRHHLGAVQTVPYSEISTVKNLSRDWVTMKLEFRLPYDTDVEQVRKIIKKIGLAMMDDEEMGPSLILPLKSQGVMRVEESALIFRMKFTSKPGEQWIIRREAYRRVKEALEQQGIHFAHRAVHVLMPQPQPPVADADQPQAPAVPPLAAAAVTSALGAELNKQGKIDDDGGLPADER